MSCYRQILVAHDGSTDANAALEHAVRLARDQHACLTLLTVAPFPHAPASMGASATPDPVDSFRVALGRAVDSVPDDVGLRTLILRGDPAQLILDTARDGGHDLIVMGSHGHGRLHRALLGSVSLRVLHDSRVPVLFMRRKGGDGGEAEVVESRSPDQVEEQRAAAGDGAIA